MGKFISKLLSYLPEEYRFSVLAKKAAYTVGKLVIAGLMYGKVGTLLGSKLTPEQVLAIQTVASVLAAAGLTAIQDFFALKYPDIKWL